MQTPMPDWLKVNLKLRPDQLRQFRKFLKLIHKLDKKRSISSVGEHALDKRT
jgi:hypothetical protein